MDRAGDAPLTSRGSGSHLERIGGLLKRSLVKRPLMATTAVALMAMLALPMAVLATTTDAIAQTIINIE